MSNLFLFAILVNLLSISLSTHTGKTKNVYISVFLIAVLLITNWIGAINELQL